MQSIISFVFVSFIWNTYEKPPIVDQPTECFCYFQLGYVEMGDKIQIQTCPGDYPDADKSMYK